MRNTTAADYIPARSASFSEGSSRRSSIWSAAPGPAAASPPPAGSSSSPRAAPRPARRGARPRVERTPVRRATSAADPATSRWATSSPPGRPASCLRPRGLRRLGGNSIRLKNRQKIGSKITQELNWKGCLFKLLKNIKKGPRMPENHPKNCLKSCPCDIYTIELPPCGHGAPLLHVVPVVGRRVVTAHHDCGGPPWNSQRGKDGG